VETNFGVNFQKQSGGMSYSARLVSEKRKKKKRNFTHESFAAGWPHLQEDIGLLLRIHRKAQVGSRSRLQALAKRKTFAYISKKKTISTPKQT